MRLLERPLQLLQLRGRERRPDPPLLPLLRHDPSHPGRGRGRVGRPQVAVVAVVVVVGRVGRRGLRRVVGVVGRVGRVHRVRGRRRCRGGGVGGVAVAADDGGGGGSRGRRGRVEPLVGEASWNMLEVFDEKNITETAKMSLSFSHSHFAVKYC